MTLTKRGTMAVFDIVTVGSAVSDVFVRTGKGTIEEDDDFGHHNVCYHVGSKILIDDIHFETGGGGTNTAVAFARMGFKTGYVGKLGSDKNSDNMLEVLRREKVQFLGGRGKGLMGFSVIMVGLHNDRTILTYKGLNNSLRWSDVQKRAFNTKRFYFSSMLHDSWQTALKIASFAQDKRIPYTFNPSLYHVKLGYRKLAPMLKGCDLLTLNKEEAEVLTDSKQGTALDDLLLKLRKIVPLVVITDGSAGAFAYDGRYKHTITPRKIHVVETTGAGDAFASGITTGLLWHMDIDDCLRIGMAEAESVIQHIGTKNILISKREAVSALKRNYRITRDVI